VFTVDAPSDRTADAPDLGAQPSDSEPGRPEDASPRPGVPAALSVAGLASLGAGAIHAAAAGAHGETRQTAIAFTVLAIAQLAWGAVVLVRSHRLLTLAGVAVNVAAVGGWVLAKSSGIGFVDGLEEAESVQFADTVAAALAAVAVVAGLLALAARLSWAGRPRPGLAAVAAVAALGIAGPAMVLTGGHSHAGAGDGHGDGMAGMDHGHGDMQAASVAPKPYDATLPVDLGGVEGVTPEQQASAEALATRTIERLPQFAADGPNEADEERLNALGYYSIGDGGTGTEHWVNWASIDDEYILDPDHPETLVFDVKGPNEKTLAAAMFMLKRGDRLGDEPDVGGKLIQWHEHQDLCYAGTPGQWVVADVAMPPDECRPGTSRLGEPVPMMHVWIRPHECGPFAALEGIGGGQVAPGETAACDHAHGTSEAAISDDAEAAIATEEAEEAEGSDAGG